MAATDMSIDTADLECPYKPGCKILLHRRGLELEAVIIETYCGSYMNVFSNSCTVLLRIIDSRPYQVLDKEMVLKIFDWRYTADQRDSLGCGSWDTKRLSELLAIPVEQKLEFEEWLCGIVPASALNHDVLGPWCHRQKFSSQSCCTDLYSEILSNLAEWTRKFSPQQLPREIEPSAITNAHKELVLRRIAELQLAREICMAEVVAEYAPGHMPRVFGSYEVRIENDPVSTTFSISGLLMEHISGPPFGDLYESIVDDNKAQELASNMILFGLKLSRCHLELSDTNNFNFILHRKSEHGVYEIKVVDYGALFFVGSHAYEKLRSIYLDVGGKHLLTRLLNYCYTDCFDEGHENNIMCTVAHRLHPASKAVRAKVQSLQSNCFDPDALGEHSQRDRYFWQTINLHILHAFDKATFHINVDAALETCRRAQRILVEEYSQQSSEPWHIRATRRIANITNNNEVEALERVQSLMNKPEPEIDFKYVVDMLADTEGRRNEVLLFPNNEVMLPTKAE